VKIVVWAVKRLHKTLYKFCQPLWIFVFFSQMIFVCSEHKSPSFGGAGSGLHPDSEEDEAGRL